MDKLVRNYHTHTKRCGHAFGEDDAFIQSAIKCGFKTVGISDHIPLPNISQPGMRAEFSTLNDYFVAISKLKEKYANQIDIHLGFEAEYLDDPKYNDYYKYLLTETPVEYLILGQHLYYKDGHLSGFKYPGVNFDEAVALYAETVVRGIKSGLFSYVAHPDFPMIFLPSVTEAVKKAFHKICRACVRYDVPVEINLHQIKGDTWKDENKMFYASRTFFEIAGHYKKLKCIIGVDAHVPEEFETVPYEYAWYLRDKYHLNVIDQFEFKKGK